MDTCGSLLLSVVDTAAFRDTVQTAHDSGLDKADRPIDVVVLDARHKHLFALLEQVLLNSADVLNVADVLVESWVNGHVFGTHGESLPMLVLVFDIENEGDAGWILAHHLFEEPSRQVDPFNDQRLVALVKRVYHFGELFGDQRALLLIALERRPTL